MRNVNSLCKVMTVTHALTRVKQRLLINTHFYPGIWLLLSYSFNAHYFMAIFTIRGSRVKQSSQKGPCADISTVHMFNDDFCRIYAELRSPEVVFEQHDQTFHWSVFQYNPGGSGEVGLPGGPEHPPCWDPCSQSPWRPTERFLCLLISPRNAQGGGGSLSNHAPVPRECETNFVIFPIRHLRLLRRFIRR